MATSRPALHIFPPPQKAKRQDSRRRVRELVPAQPAVDLAKPSANLHELVMRIDAPTHDSPAVVATPRNTQITPPQQSIPTFASSPPTRGLSPVSSPERACAGSPAFSDILSARSGSPTLVRTNSTASHQSPIGPCERPLMRSIFPQYNHDLPLAQQQYHPTHVCPAHLPREKISRSPYSPTSLAQSGSSSSTPYFTPNTEYRKLWEAANGRSASLSPRSFTLQMHRPIELPRASKNGIKISNINFGSSSTLPFYSLTQYTPRASAQDTQGQGETEAHELLISRHHPSKSATLPVTHLDVSPPPPPSSINSVPSPLRSPTPGGQSLCVTTICPKLAALQALETAANSAAASSLSLVDPNATSPAAVQLAKSAVQEAADRESCTLVWTADTSRHGRYELAHPTLGVFPIAVQGDIGRTVAAPSASSSSVVGGTNGPAVISLLGPASANRQSRHVEAGDDALAQLDIAHGALTLNAVALQELGKPYLIDVAASTLFAVMVAEARRGQDPALVFSAPPVSLAKKETSKVYNQVESAEAQQTKPNKGKGKQNCRNGGVDAQDKEVPKITRGLLSILGLTLKTVVWLLGLGVKVLAKLLVGMSRCPGRA